MYVLIILNFPQALTNVEIFNQTNNVLVTLRNNPLPGLGGHHMNGQYMLDSEKYLARVSTIAKCASSAIDFNNKFNNAC